MRRFAFLVLILSGGAFAAMACGGSNDGGLFDNGSGGAGADASGGAGQDASGNTTVNGSKDGGNNNNNGNDAGNGNNGNDAGNGNGGKDAGSDSGSITGTPCNVDTGGTSNDCNFGEACIANTCVLGKATTGVCVKVTQTNQMKPVCGCDGVNYWNSSVASGFSAAIASFNTCSVPSLCKGGAGAATCPAFGQADCAFEAVDLGGAGCGMMKSPVCWGMPTTCPTNPDGGVTPCSNQGNCNSLCDAIKNQTPYRNNGCKVM
jgi:hypothetical protein